MAEKRKLQQEIDKTLKKVYEGIDVFGQIFSKVHEPINTSQKEKLEGELKREIKKLQRYRDNIKSWQASSDVKDKGPLDQARKDIEKEMERFKLCEREFKMKAYSKEGLAQKAKVDPHEAERERHRNWIRDSLEKLGTSVDLHEAEQETLETKPKSKQKAKDVERSGELTKYITRHQWHMQKLELILRRLDNDRIHLGKLSEIQDGLDYYLEHNEDATFYFDEEMYKNLNLDEPEEEDEWDAQKTSDDYSDSEDKDDSTTSLQTQPPTSTSPSTLNRPSSNEFLQTKAIKSPAITADTAPKMPSPIKTAAPTPPPKPSTPLTNILASAPAISSPSAPPPGVASRGRLIPSPASAKPSPGPSLGRGRGAEDGSHLPSYASVTGNSPTKARVLPSTITQVHPSASTTASNVPPRPSTIEADQTTDHGQSEASTLERAAHTGSSQVRSSRKDSASGAPSSLGGSESVSSTTTPSAAPASTSGAFPRRRPENETQGPVVSKYQEDQPTSVRAFDEATQGIRPDQFDTVSHHDRTEALHMLETSFCHITEPSDSQRFRTYVPNTPWHRPHPDFPTQPLANFADSSLFENQFEQDTLFFIFYYQQGTYQQFLAARELKKQSWRYHKQHLTWFQRHEEPAVTNDAYEQGIYVYFDYGSGWCSRIKQNFVFEYVQLENDLLV